MGRIKKRFVLALSLLAMFALWTAAVRFVDVQAIGPKGACVGFARLNGAFHRRTGVHFFLYEATDWLSLIPIGICAGFGMLGLGQWIARKRLGKVDRDLLVLGGFYVLVIAAYMLFEVLVINYRPVLIDGRLEASYPSSTTLLVLCVMMTAMMQAHRRIKRCAFRNGVNLVMAAFTLFMVIGRLLSGVHWLTDIVGGALLSAGLVALYGAVYECVMK